MCMYRLTFGKFGRSLPDGLMGCLIRERDDGVFVGNDTFYVNLHLWMWFWFNLRFYVYTFIYYR